MSIPRLPLLVFLFAFASLPAQLDAKIIHVNASNGASAATPYGSWSSAAATLQDAIKVSTAGDEIWVAAGTYYPDEGGTEINDNRYASFFIRDRVALYGGFTGTETDLSAANPSANVTILSGEIQQDNNIANNSYHVIQAFFLEADTILQGFTIEKGNANGPDPAVDQRGGGILCSFSSLQIINCHFFDNRADRGGAVYISDQSNPTITNCSFQSNIATSYGGAIHNFNSSNPVIADCSFAENRAAFGGAILNESSAPSVTDCNFQSNTATTNGGGVHNFSGSSPTYTRCSFQLNTAATTGGGMINYINSSPTLTNCSFKGNEAQYAGALVNDLGSSPVIKSCVFAGNFASIRGGAIVNQNSCEPDFTNCSFQGNRAGADGGAIFNAASCVASLKNCIIGNNAANSNSLGQSASVFNQAGGSMTYQFCMVWEFARSTLNASGTGSGNNFSFSNPLFGKQSNPFLAPSIDGDLRLRRGSPLIDNGGLGSYIPEDLAGNPRVQNGRIDLGAYEGFAAEFDYLYEIRSRTVTITGYVVNETTVIIPDTLDGLPVTQIENFTFADRTNLTSVTIPESVTFIRSFAFSNCSSLTGIEVSPGNPNYSAENGVLFFTSDDEFHLYICPEGKTGAYSIPDDVTSIGSVAFHNCSSLTSVTIPESVTLIGNGAFYNCSSLTGIEVSPGNPNYSAENGVLFFTSDDQFMLHTCPAGKTGAYSIPDDVTSIGDRAFIACSSLTSITIPDGVTSIGDFAFYECSSITSITIPDGVTSIGDFAFYECSSLTSITLPAGLTSIGNTAFHECSSLTSITLPAGVTSIGNFAFFACSSLVEVSFLGNAPALVGTGLFSGLPPEARVYYQQGATGWGATFGGLTTEEVTLFEYTSANNAVTITRYVGNQPTVIIPDTLDGLPVTQIGNGAFADRTILTVTLPASVTSIGNSAFQSCSNLTSITLPAGLTSIGSSTFERCSSLISVTLPEGLTSIGNSAFFLCSSLTSLTLPESLTSIGSSTFERCSNLISVTLPEGLTSIGNSAFFLCSSLTSITLPAGLTSIGGAAFFECSSLTSITLPAGLTSIGSSTFERCSSLISVTLPEGLTSIGNLAFWSCSSLTSLTLPEGLTSIGIAAFFECSSLTSLTLPAGVTSIGSYAFRRCISLTSLTLPASLTSIGDFAFSACSSLVEVSFLGNAPALVGTDHFSGLPPEARVYYQAGTSGWGIEFGGIPTVQVTLNFSDWIGAYPGVGAETGVGADPDRDGIPSGLENFFGTDPSVFSAGMVVVRKNGTTLTLSHPKAASSAPDLTVVYEWSSDMTVFYPAGSSNAAGTTTVNFTPSKDNPGTTTVTAQISGSVIPKKVFVRLSVREVDEM